MLYYFLWGRLATCGGLSIRLFVGQPILAAAAFQAASSRRVKALGRQRECALVVREQNLQRWCPITKWQTGMARFDGIIQKYAL
jgi:hypothetical protein